MSAQKLGRALLVLGALATGTSLTGCAASEQGADVVKGKQLFIQKCSACHTLARANTVGVVGPNLDTAFAQSLHDGLRRSTIRGVVHDQILYPARRPQMDPMTRQPNALMPPKLVKGADAHSVAAYVAQSASNPGQDTGQLALVGTKKPTGTAKEQNGKLIIPADPTGTLAYDFSSATATAGTVTIEMPNKAPIQHDIALQSGTNGPVIGKGAIVSSGGTSQFTATLKPGKYTYYCTVPGHRAGGMFGTLTVK
jgi:plastocyanin